MASGIPEFKGTIACGLSSTKSASDSRQAARTAVVPKDGLRRHEEAERKRLESVKRQRESYAQKQNVISAALKSIDHHSLSVAGASVNKKIKFSSSSSCSSSDQDSDVEVPAAKSISGKSTDASSTAAANGRKLLFGDSDEDEEDNYEFDTQKFNGTIGAKLLELQSKYGGADQRFKLDARFLDDDDDSKDRIGQQQDGDAKVLREERHTNIRILEKVLGRPLEKDGEESFKNSKTVPYLRYDPENPAHRQFQVQKEEERTMLRVNEDPASEPSSSVGESDEDAPADKSDPTPTGLDSEFAERLRQGQAGGQRAFHGDKEEAGFSLRKLFGREDSANDDSGVSQTHSASAVNLTSWQHSLMRVKDSSSEDEQEMKLKSVSDSAAKLKDEAGRTRKTLAAPQSLFFFYDGKDKRILSEGVKFRRLEDIETVRRRWEKQRVGLIQFYKSRRKEALKKQRLRKEKEAAGKGKRIDKSTSSSKKQRKS